MHILTTKPFGRFASAVLGRDASPRRPRVLSCAEARTVRGTVPTMRPCSGFTVLELTLVLGVLAMLLAIVIPTIKTVRAAVLRNRAGAEATALAQAVIHYKNEYGFWPGQLQVNPDNTVALHLKPEAVNGFIPVIVSGPKTFTDNIKTTGSAPIPLHGNEVCQALSRLLKPAGGTIAFDPNPLNPKGIHFLDLEAEGDMEHVDFLDPWGRGYILFMGLNPASTFTHTVTFPNGGSQVMRVDNNIAFAFSFGPDGENSTNYIYSAGVKR